MAVDVYTFFNLQVLPVVNFVDQTCFSVSIYLKCQMDYHNFDLKFDDIKHINLLVSMYNNRLFFGVSFVVGVNTAIYC